MKARYKEKCFCTTADVERAVKQEFDAKIDDVYLHVKHDVAAQIMAVCLVELQTEFGYGTKRLQRFYNGVKGLFRVMDNDGIFGREFTPLHCIEIMREKYAIDVDMWGD